MDGWCTGLILADVFAAYEAMAAGRGRPDGLAEPAPSYRAYIEWLSRQDSGAAADFWRARLAGWEPVRLSSAGTAGADREGGLLGCDLAGHIDARLRVLSRRGITLNTIVVGAWALVLSSVTGSNRVIVGSATAGRPADLEEADRIVGLFVSTLPLPIEVEPGATIVDWLERLQALQVEARAFDYVSPPQI